MPRKKDEPAQPPLPEIFDSLKTLSHGQTVLLPVDTLFARADQSLLRVLKEDKRVERKAPIQMKPDQLADYYSMWANTAPDGGLIAIGIANDGKAVGCLKCEIEHLNKLEHEAGNQCPDARVECKRVPIRRDADGEPDYVFLFRVKYNPNRVVFTTRSEAFVRRGESKHKLTHHEIVDLKNDKGEIRVEQELCPEYQFPYDFNAELLVRLTDQVNLALSEPLSTADILVARHLGKHQGGRFVPNGACVLAFAKDPRQRFAGAKIFLLRFQGEHQGVGTDLNTVKHEFVEGNIPELLDQTRDWLTSQLRQFSRLGPDNRFYSSPEYPRAVWMEAVLNACLHRSYGTFKAMSIYVKMFDDRLEIESPGGFPPGITPQNIYGLSHPRNPFLMEALWFLGYAKNMGEGTRRMLKLMQDSALPPPEFRQTEVGHVIVRVTLRNDYHQRKEYIDSAVAVSIISPEVYVTLSEDEKSVVNHIAEHQTINVSQAQRITKRGWKSASRMLARLAGRGLLKHIHRTDLLRDPEAHYVLVPPPATEPTPME